MFRLILVLSTLFILLTQCTLEPGDVSPPTVVTIFPYEGAVISANVDVTIGAVDNNEIEKVWYYLDGIKSGETTSSPYNISLDISIIEKNVTHTIQSAAVDNDGNIGFASLVNFVVSDNADILHPTIRIVNPHDDQVVEEMVLVMAYADDDRSVQKVAFFVDAESLHVTSQYPYVYEWDTSGYPDSTQHTIFAKAFDGGNNKTVSDPVIVTVYKQVDETRDTTTPSVVILYPVADTDVSGTIPVSIDFLDNIGVEKIEFYVDGQLKNSASQPASPWIFNWSTTGLAVGAHTLYVKAYDAVGNVGTSALMRVNIP